MDELKKALDAIQIQINKLPEYHLARIVGMQLQDILRSCPGAATIVLQDMQGKGFSLTECEKKIKAKADEIHKKRGGNVGMDGRMTDMIIREFYGIAEFAPETAEEKPKMPETPEKPAKKLLRLADFMD